MKNYYWMDFAEGSAILYSMDYTEDGCLDHDTEKEVYRVSLDSLEGLRDAEDSGDIELAYEIIDADIKKELGYLPDYEVG